MKFKELRSVLPTDSVYNVLHLYADLDLPYDIDKPDLRELVEELGYSSGIDADDEYRVYETGYVNPFHVDRLIKSRLTQAYGEVRPADHLARIRELENHVFSRFDSLEVARVYSFYDGTVDGLRVHLVVPEPSITVH